MPGPQATRNPEGASPPAESVPSAEVSKGAASASMDLILGVGVASSDETPTVISKQLPDHGGIASGIVDPLLTGALRGRTLAHFELLDPIGVGGMAAVLLARDKQ